jgi:hypothetical protein
MTEGPTRLPYPSPASLQAPLRPGRLGSCVPLSLSLPLGDGARRENGNE